MFSEIKEENCCVFKEAFCCIPLFILIVSPVWDKLSAVLHISAVVNWINSNCQEIVVAEDKFLKYLCTDCTLGLFQFEKFKYLWKFIDRTILDTWRPHYFQPSYRHQEIVNMLSMAMTRVLT